MRQFQLSHSPTSGILAALIVAMFTGMALAANDQGSDWTKPFEPDEHTVVLYHFDEGQGNESQDACGDPALTLRAQEQALWGSRPGFGTTARFDRQNDHLLIGPTNNDKLQLRTCTKEWTIEAWVRYTGPGGKDRANSWPPGHGYIFANICGSDEEGCALADGYRHGWLFYLRTTKSGPRSTREEGLMPGARFLGSHKGKDPNNDVGGAFWPGYHHGWLDEDRGRFRDTDWHHVAWQFRYRDQTGFMYVDGKMTRKVPLPAPGRAATRIIVNDAKRCDIPFQVGGFLRPVDRPNWTPGDFGMTMYNMDGQIDEIRISKVMRFPVTDKLAILRQKLPDAGLKIPYKVQLGTDAATGNVTWKMMYPKSMPRGLVLDGKTGVIHGTPEELVQGRTMTILAEDQAGATDKHTFALTVEDGRLVTESLPPAFNGTAYQTELQSQHMAAPLRWEVVSGSLPPGLTLDRETGELMGTPAHVGVTKLAIQVTDANGILDHRDFVLRVLPDKLRVIAPDNHTVALYDWQGPSGRLIEERIAGGEATTLTYTNMGADRRYSWPGRVGQFPQEAGHGEHGYASLGKGVPRLDMKTCDKQWTVEAWVRRGGPYQAFGDIPLMKFDYGHVCGSYDKSERGVWELYISEIDSPDGSMAPGVHFQSADYSWKDLDPWKRPEGIVAERSEVGIIDTQWHHIAWQYNYAEDLHQLLLDGKLIWQMKSPDGHQLVNDREHEAQFSVFSRLGSYTKNGIQFDESTSTYVGDFNYLGFGNFFGQIGEIRISNIRRY